VQQPLIEMSMGNLAALYFFYAAADTSVRFALSDCQIPV
jgi:hypothetical protein